MSISARLPELIVSSPKMSEVVTLATRAGACDSKVLVTGESGVGKDLVAQQVHASSARRTQPFVAVNCAGLTETLLESELFGHVKGSFTGAYRDQPGKLQQAHRGTLFLDEVGEMSLRMQALLLRFLENGEVQPVGADRTAARVDARVIAATNRQLPEMVATGRFREDLLYRLRVIHIEVPPLRQRTDDVRTLVAHFAKRAGRPIHFSDAALAALERFRWPGNVRELQNVVEQVIWLSGGDVVEYAHLPPAIRGDGVPLLATRERRTRVADQLYDALVDGGYTFWDHIYPLFLARDITRQDLRQLVKRGLSVVRGNYRALLRLFGMPASDYKRFLNFLGSHDCRVDFREFRTGTAESRREPSLVLPPLTGASAPASADRF